MTETLHIKKFDGGNRTPQEMHAQYAFPRGARCAGCGKRPSVRAIVLAPLEEAVKRGMVHPNTPHDALIPRVVPIQETSAHKPKAYVRISCTYSCKKCQKDMEVALAKGPSWCIVEINRGPDPENRIIVAT